METDKVYENLSKKKRPNWDERYTMTSVYQIPNHNQKKSEFESVEGFIKEVRGSINQWIKDQDLTNQLEIMDAPILLSEIKKEEIKSKIIEKLGEKNKYRYLWVSFRDDGMIVVIGKTSFEKGSGYGDLFDKYDILGTGTQRLILEYLSKAENDETVKHDVSESDSILREKSSGDSDIYINRDIINKINSILNNFSSYALILLAKVDDARAVGRLETELGNMLTSKYPVFNYYSHNW